MNVANTIFVNATANSGVNATANSSVNASLNASANTSANATAALRRPLAPIALRGDLLDFTAEPAWGDVASPAVRLRPDTGC